MFIILHGENIVSSRRALGELKNKNKDKEIIIFEGKKLNLTDLKQALEAKSLFGQEKLIVVENLLFQKTKIFDYLKSLSNNVSLILWEEREVKSNTLSQFKNAKIFHFKLPVIIFKFLESMMPGNNKNALFLLQQLLKTEPEELIFYMLVRQFRMLLAVKQGVLAQIPEFQRLASWQIKKLKRQARFFSTKNLISIYKRLLKIDYQQKTGRSSVNLGQRLEYLLTTIDG